MAEPINEALKVIKNAKNIVVLSGAGMSTASGIPDFRSKTGVYTTNPSKILSRQFFFENPGEFYDFVFENLYYPDAKPNLGHEILAKWEKDGRLSQIITQNVDGLHSAAGNENVIEFHGTRNSATCYNPKCKKEYSVHDLAKRKQAYEKKIDAIYDKFDDDFATIKKEKKKIKPYYICDCGESGTRRYIKLDTVLFGDVGQWFSTKGFNTIRKSIHSADLILILGTGLQVYPFGDFPAYKREDTPIIIINKGETNYDNVYGVIKIEEDIAETLHYFDQNS